MSRKQRSLLIGSAVVAAMFAFTACTTIKTTTTARTATEQLLLSTATDHALRDIGVQMLAGRRVFLDGSYFDSIDSKYVLGTIRDALSRAGALVVDTATNSDIIIEARSGALAIDEADTLFGLPGMGVPIPLAGSVQTPEIAFYKSEKQKSRAKFVLVAYNRHSAAHIYSSGPLDGASFDARYRAFFVSWHRSDVPEKQPTAEKMQKRQTWSPQYDLENLTVTNEPGSASKIETSTNAEPATKHPH